jgi:hypothetical protein
MLLRLSALRRCRALLALAVFAWLGLGMQVVALASPADCCVGMAMPMTAQALPMPEMPPHGHPDGMTAANCPCAHSAASVPLPEALSLAVTMPPVRPVPATVDRAPQPARIPLLRPPLPSSYVATQNA